MHGCGRQPTRYRTKLATDAFTLLALLFLVSQMVSAADTPKPASEGSYHILVLKTGKVLEGLILPSPGGYMIHRSVGNSSVGSVFMNANLVECVGFDLKDAYYKQRDSRRAASFQDYMSLANWCLDYQLYDQAKEELRLALRRDPNSVEARKLLQKIDAYSNSSIVHAPAQSTDNFSPPAGVEARREWNSSVNPEGQLPPQSAQLGHRTNQPNQAAGNSPAVSSGSLTSLSKGLGTTFNTRVQPLLQNKCGNANCHGEGARTEFRLSGQAGQGGSRVGTERNLQSVVAQLDFDNPLDSPLLIYAQQSHGQMNALVFRGPQGAAQLKTISDWVLNLSAAQRPKPPEILLANQVGPQWPVSTRRAGDDDNTPESVADSQLTSHSQIPPTISSDRDGGTREAELATHSQRTAMSSAAPSFVDGQSDALRASLAQFERGRPAEQAVVDESAITPLTTSEFAKVENEHAVDLFNPDAFNLRFHQRPAGTRPHTHRTAIAPTPKRR